MPDSVSMVGWTSVREITDFLSGAARMIRCDKLMLELTVPNKKVLRDTTWVLVERGFHASVSNLGEVFCEKGRISLTLTARGEDQ